jgi:peptide chain release factor 1
MRASIRKKLDALVERREEVGRLLADPTVTGNPVRFRDLSREYAQLEPVARALSEHDAACAQLEAARALSDESDADLAELAAEEVARLTSEVEETERRLEAELVPRDPRDDLGLFLEVRAGTGGDEAALFAGDLVRMYLRYSESHGWRAIVLEASPGEHGGYKKVVVRIEGQGAWSRLRFEAGTHRVQRVPETEAQGRIHTSACTVAVLPEAAELEDATINPADLRVDTFRSSGAGGQHVNKTESAIRITHVPSGIVVESQSERSQHANREHAMRRLGAELAERERIARTAQTAESRRQQVGSGDRSERIRTYNFPQGRVTEHRINLTLYALDRVLEGELEPLVEPLLREYQAEQLRHLTEAS